MLSPSSPLRFFFFNDTATTEIYTLSLHDALPILRGRCLSVGATPNVFSDKFPVGGRDTFQHRQAHQFLRPAVGTDRKSTRLNSSHSQISYAVFCLKKKKNYHFSPSTPPKSM